VTSPFRPDNPFAGSQYHPENPFAAEEYARLHRFKNPDLAAPVAGTNEQILPSPPRQPGLPERLIGPAQALSQGATLGFGDELAGLADLAQGKNYTVARDAARRLQHDYASKHPTANALLQIAGSLPWAAVAPGSAVKGGALLGGVMGLGSAEGSVPKQILQTGASAGLGALTGGLLSKAATVGTQGIASRGTGALVRAAKTGGTDLPAAIAERATLPPEIAAVTPAITNAGTEEVGMLNRVLRSPKGTKLGRTVEDRFAGLERVKGKIGKEFDRLVMTPEEIPIPATPTPELAQVLSAPETKAQTAVIKNAWARVPKSRWIGGVEKTFKGTLQDALDSGIPLPGDLAQVAGKGNLGASVTFKYTEPRQPTAEFLWRLHQEIGRRMKVKPSDVGVLGDLKGHVAQSLENSVPGSTDLFRRYATVNDVIDQTAAKTGAVWDDIARRWVVKTHSGGVQAAPYEIGHAVTRPFSPYGAAAVLRRFSPSIARPQERAASAALLRTGNQGTGLLADVLRRVQTPTRPMAGLLGGAGGGQIPPLLFPPHQP